MDPIDLEFRVGRLPAAAPAVGGELSAEELDANFSNLRTACEQLDAEKIGVADAAPLTALSLPVVGSDQVVVFRGGQGYLAPATAFGVANSAPGAFSVGQWAVSPIAGGLRFNITALPTDGGSAITALQYRLSSGDAPVNFTGTGTGIRDITGLAATSRDTQVRAVNAVGAGPWSDVKTVTPGAGAGGAMSVVNATNGETFGTGVAITFPAVGSGNSIVIACTQDKPTVRVNGSLEADASTTTLFGNYTHFFHIDNITDGRTSVTLTAFNPTAADSNFAWCVYELNAAGVVVASTIASATGNDTAPVVGFTTTAADAAAFKAVKLSNGTTQTAANGWVAVPGASSFDPFGYIANAGAAGAKTSDMTLGAGRQWGAVVQAYRRA